jgi:hypothetical protein
MLSLSCIQRRIATTALVVFLAVIGTVAVGFGFWHQVVSADPVIHLEVLDSAGQKSLTEFRVLAGTRSNVSQRFEKEHGVKVVNWQPHTLRQGSDGSLIWPLKRAYADLCLRVEADGYVPQVLHDVRKNGPRTIRCELHKDPGISGSVMTPGGQRAAHDATVLLAMIRRNAYLKGSVFPELALREIKASDDSRTRWERPIVVKPDDRGRFTLPTEPDPTAVVLIVHNDGVLEIPFSEWRESPHVTLQPWGRIHGWVRWGDTRGMNEQVDLSADHGDGHGYPGIVGQHAETTTNNDGVFVFERVLPGRAQLSCPIHMETKDGQQQTAYLRGRVTHANVQTPHTSVLIGGRGRSVSGRLTGLKDFDGVTFHLHPNAPHFGREGDALMWAAWYRWKNSPAGPQFFRDGLAVAADGTFQIPDILPGYYQIFFSRDGRKEYIASGKFRIQSEDHDVPPLPVAVGDFRVRSAAR